jgi:hypothetical protein
MDRVVANVRAPDSRQTCETVETYAMTFEPGSRGQNDGSVKGGAPGVVRRVYRALLLQEFVAREFRGNVRAKRLAIGSPVISQRHPFIPDLLEVFLIGRGSVSGFQMQHAADSSYNLRETSERGGGGGCKPGYVGRAVGARLRFELLRGGIVDWR